MLNLMIFSRSAAITDLREVIKAQPPETKLVHGALDKKLRLTNMWILHIFAGLVPYIDISTDTQMCVESCVVWFPPPLLPR